MPAIGTPAQLDTLLAMARIRAAETHCAVAITNAEMDRQLTRLQASPRAGRCPIRAEKHQLKFGHTARHELNSHPVAEMLYRLALLVICWNPSDRPERAR